MELFLSEPRNRHVFSGLRVPFARCSRPRHFGATALDRRVAKTFARYATPAMERPARVLTWAADEHILGVIAGGLWLAARGGNERERRQSDHLVLSVVVTAILPHLLKRLIDQKRPPWAATGHTPFGQALRCFSVWPCHACRRGRFRRLLGLSKVGARRLGTWRPHCSNTDRHSGALASLDHSFFTFDSFKNMSLNAKSYPVRRTGAPGSKL